MAWFVWRRRPNERKAPQAEEKRRRQANSARRRPKKYVVCCDLPALLARVSPALLSQSSSTSRRSLFTRDRERAKAYCRSVCAVFLFTRAIRKGGAPRPAPAPKQEGIHPTGRRSPFGGGAGRRLPCPNGALLEKNGQATRREEAAGASRWGLGSENRPSRQWALNTGRPAPGI